MTKDHKNIWIVVLACLLLVSAGINIVAWRETPWPAPSPADDAKTIVDVEAYLDSIATPYVADVQALAKDRAMTAWGCGPSSYALAHILDRKFFGGRLPIKAAYDNTPRMIVVRFGFADDPGFADSKALHIDDHVWLQVYLGNQMLFIDPTIGQFGKLQGIAHHVFRTDDPDIPSYMQERYGIRDMRIRPLVQKIVTGVPANQEPYPNVVIPPDQMNYYFQVILDRDDVDAGKMPPAWADWVKTLTDKYD